MKGFLLFILACGVAALAPLAAKRPAQSARADAFPGWPAAFEGRPLRETPLTEGELAFNGSFPGRMARFTDGSRTIILRWVTAPTHRVHSAAHCLRAAGRKLEPGDWKRDADGAVWSTWTVSGPGESFTIRERCLDPSGRSWPDVSAWFWAALLDRTEGPWWVVTVAEGAPAAPSP